jgi:CheY-like chemotaxis protein
MNSAWTVPGSHAVQFYENEQFLQRAVAEFFTGARPGEPLILVSRPRTYTAVAAHLASGRYGSAINADSIQFFDAEAALPQIMEGESLDLVRAERFLTQTLSQSIPSHAQGAARLYGEVVDILCQSGRHSAALQFEGLADSLFDRQPQLSILCGYAIERFKDDSKADLLRAVCQNHTQVISAEGFTALHDATPVQSVYIIDDDTSLRRSLSRLLSAHRWPVQTFDSAEAFLGELDSLSSGCLVVDIGLPGISGLELLQRLKDARVSWPVIVMSGLSDKRAESDALRLGARAYLSKPFNSRSLLNAIARAALFAGPVRRI